MSGRSGYVRARQQLRNAQTPAPAQKSTAKTSAASSSGRVSMSTSGSINLAPTVSSSGYVGATIPRSTSLAPVLPSTGYVSVTNSGPTEAGGYSFDSTHPQFERSNLRVKVEERSEVIRNGLSSVFSIGKKLQNESASRTASPEPGNPDASYHAGIGSEEKHAPNIHLWLPNCQLASADDEFFTDKHMWLDDGDTIIFLTPEDQHGNVMGAPSFRVNSQALTTCFSTFWLTLLKEGVRTPEYGREVAQTLIQAQDQMPSSFNEMMTREENSLFEGVKYMISFAPPDGLNRKSLLRWRHMVRNAMAILHNMPGLVGCTYYGMFSDVYECFLDCFDEKNESARLVLGYINRYNYHDVRLNASAAIGLLAISEKHEWEAGYREAFVHCIGMHRELKTLLRDGLDGGAISKLKPITRRLLNDHALEMQNRILICAERLKTFSLKDMWVHRIGDNIEAKDAFDESGPFFLWFYTRNGEWAQDDEDGNLWLRPATVFRLQQDFGALYDDLVDRSAQFQSTEAGWTIVRPSSIQFNADTDGISMTRILSDFDDQNGYAHMPYPFPILPISIVPVETGRCAQPGGTKSRGLLGLLKKKKKEPKSEPAKDIQQSTVTKFQLAFTKASNSQILGAKYPGNDLAEAFLNFEQVTDIGKVDPRVVRRGRWAFIYGILQTLASVSESVPELIFPTDELDYFTCSSMQGLPHWTRNEFASAHMSTSHCWTVGKTWA